MHKLKIEKSSSGKLQKDEEFQDENCSDMFQKNSGQERCCCIRCILKHRLSNSIDSIGSKGGKIAECRTADDYFELMVPLTESLEKASELSKILVKRSAFWNDPSPGMEGLSVLGSYIWLLSYAAQPIVDEHTKENKKAFPKALSSILTIFTEICIEIEKFLETAEYFHYLLHKLRQYAIVMVKRLFKKLGKGYHDPVKRRLEEKGPTPMQRPRRRIGAGLDATKDEDEDEDLFQVHWCPWKIMIRSDKSPWIPFESVSSSEKIETYTKCLRKTFETAKDSVEELTTIMTELSMIQIQANNAPFYIMDIVAGILIFSETVHHIDKAEQSKHKLMMQYLDRFWTSTDTLHDSSNQLLIIAQETKLVSRTCYVYVDHFYKWNMPPYDSIWQPTRKKHKQPQGGVKDFWDKFTIQDSKITDAILFLSLMDFTSSIYQVVVHQYGIQCDNIYMKLVDSSGTAEEESWSLLHGDKRKSKSSVRLHRHHKYLS